MGDVDIQLIEQFMKSGWEMLNDVTNGDVCADRSCIRCRVANILFELEQLTISK